MSPASTLVDHVVGITDESSICRRQRNAGGVCGASKESFCRGREFLSSKMGVSGVWSNLVSGTSVSREQEAPPRPSDAQLVNTLTSRDGINSQRSFE